MNLHLTDNAPPWLVLAFLAVGLGAYALCGLLVLGAQVRRRWSQRIVRREARHRAVLTPTRQLPPVGTQVHAEVTS